MLPPDKRNPVITAFLNALLAPLQWISRLWLVEYTAGTTAAAWSNAITYAKYDQVIYQKVVFESQINANTSNPLTPIKWTVVQNNFIGLGERILYNGGCLTLTYALNKWFGTVFRQATALSDIYISTNTLVAPVFRVGTTEGQSSSVSTIGSSEFVGTSDAITVAVNISIFVPVAVYNTLDVAMINNNKIFRNFADRYIPAGLIYTVSTY